MIKDNMFFTNPTIKDYREMDIPNIIKEYLKTKGTWFKSPFKNDIPQPINKSVNIKNLITSGLFVYGLKDNSTNKRAIEYYCERWGHINQIIDEKGVINIPKEIWDECDEYNRIHTNGRDRNR